MNNQQIIFTIVVVMLGTVLTRAFPFLLFPGNKEPPAFVNYLGQVLPMAAIGMLVIYCFRNVNFTTRPFGIPEALCFLFVVLMHRWRHNLLLSIGGGTILYMFLIQSVFNLS